jgi:hypothetical protein
MWNVRLSNRSLRLNPWISITDLALNYSIYFDWTHATLPPFLLSDLPLNHRFCLSYLTPDCPHAFWANRLNEGAMGEPSVNPSLLNHINLRLVAPSLLLNSKIPYHNYSIHVHLRWWKLGISSRYNLFLTSSRSIAQSDKELECICVKEEIFKIVFVQEEWTFKYPNKCCWNGDDYSGVLACEGSRDDLNRSIFVNKRILQPYLQNLQPPLSFTYAQRLRIMRL